MTSIAAPAQPSPSEPLFFAASYNFPVQPGLTAAVWISMSKTEPTIGPTSIERSRTPCWNIPVFYPGGHRRGRSHCDFLSPHAESQHSRAESPMMPYPVIPGQCPTVCDTTPGQGPPGVGYQGVDPVRRDAQIQCFTCQQFGHYVHP
jgi:hypothetical protein